MGHLAFWKFVNFLMFKISYFLQKITSFFRIEPIEETALLGFKNMLAINGYEFEKKAFTPKDQIMYVIYDVRPSDPEHVYLFYLLRTRKGYEAWYEYRKNQDCVINKEELIITYEREN